MKGRDINVHLASGTYELSDPLLFGAKGICVPKMPSFCHTLHSSYPELHIDSGAGNGAYVHWQGPGKGTAIISGGVKLTGWTKVPNNTVSVQQCAANHGTSTPCCGQPGQPVR